MRPLKRVGEIGSPTRRKLPSQLQARASTITEDARWERAVSRNGEGETGQRRRTWSAFRPRARAETLHTAPVFDLARRVRSSLLSLCYPPHCESCHAATEPGVYLCERCTGFVRRLEPPFCERCSRM